MTSFPFAHAGGNDWQDACDRILGHIGPIPAGHDLAFIYATDHLCGDLQRIVRYLRSNSGVRHWVGTVGTGICSTGREFYGEPALAVMVTDLCEEQFRIIPGFSGSNQVFLDATRAWREEHSSYFAVVHGDPQQSATPSLAADLADQLHGGFLVGGLTSAENQQYLQIADDLTQDGVSGVLLSGEVKVATGLSQGCTLTGRKHVITKSERNIIATLDGRPALDVFKEEIGDILARDLSRTAGYIFAALPIPGSDTGDYLVRNLIGIDPENGLLAVGDLLEEGQTIQFAKRDGESAREDLVTMIRQLNERIETTPKGALYHSCLGRGRHLFGEDSQELKLIQAELGDVPLVGFYANGEIAHHRLYGYTGVLTLFL